MVLIQSDPGLMRHINDTEILKHLSRLGESTKYCDVDARQNGSLMIRSRYWTNPFQVNCGPLLTFNIVLDHFIRFCVVLSGTTYYDEHALVVAYGSMSPQWSRDIIMSSNIFLSLIYHSWKFKGFWIPVHASCIDSPELIQYSSIRRDDTSKHVEKRSNLSKCVLITWTWLIEHEELFPHCSLHIEDEEVCLRLCFVFLLIYDSTTM